MFGESGTCYLCVFISCETNRLVRFELLNGIVKFATGQINVDHFTPVD